MNSFSNGIDFAKNLDEQDALKSYRDKFYFPKMGKKEVLYFTGNSLGLQPKATQDYVLNELEDWASFGVEGHFMARNPWYSYHELLTNKTARIVGAMPEEVIVMNQLTVNLHLLMVSFFKPGKIKKKIICEAKAFPSDLYALQSQLRFHGLNPETDLILLEAQDGAHYLKEEDIYKAIEFHKEELALVMMGGVNFYSGQVLDMKAITKAGHQAGAVVGFDLAHAAGNVILNLHDWEVDFACWCNYKYLNAGPGSVAGAFVHKKHLADKNLPLFAGWWGHNKTSRFKMESVFSPMETAERWQLSNAPILSMAAYKASLDIFDEVGMDTLVQKSKMLTAYLAFTLLEINKLSPDGNPVLEIITPQNRGAQLSILLKKEGKGIFNKLMEKGVVTDWREPNVIRLAPVPLYNSFLDIFQFGQLLASILKNS